MTASQLRNITASTLKDEPIVVTGIGLVTALGLDRETTWRNIQQGRCGIGRSHGIRGLPDGLVFAAHVDLGDEPTTELKSIRLSRRAAAEAIEDAHLDWQKIDRTRMGCCISGHMGDTRGIEAIEGYYQAPVNDPFPWWDQIFPNAGCHAIAEQWGLYGPRLSHSTACASGLISLLSAVRAIRDGQCEIAVAGGGEAINALFAAGFRNMRALADGGLPHEACLPFDVRRKGFVMGEGAAVFVVERASHALARGAKVYCSITPGRMVSEAHHVTGIESDSDALQYLIEASLRQSGLQPADISYINAHGTGTEQNDAAEIAGISKAFAGHLSDLQVSATKSQIGHLVKAAGCAELAITILGLRDGVAPPTVNLLQPEPDCQFDCVPRKAQIRRFQNALKLSLAFGGHLVGVVVSRWNDARSGFAYPTGHQYVA